MTAQLIDSLTRQTFSPAEQRKLRALRDRYEQDQDRFSERERAHLGFVRWLVDSARVSR